eukprot:344344_1
MECILNCKNLTHGAYDNSVAIYSIDTPTQIYYTMLNNHDTNESSIIIYVQAMNIEYTSAVLNCGNFENCHIICIDGDVLYEHYACYNLSINSTLSYNLLIHSNYFAYNSIWSE